MPSFISVGYLLVGNYLRTTIFKSIMVKNSTLNGQTYDSQTLSRPLVRTHGQRWPSACTCATTTLSPGIYITSCSPPARRLGDFSFIQAPQSVCVYFGRFPLLEVPQFSPLDLHLHFQFQTNSLCIADAYSARVTTPHCTTRLSLGSTPLVSKFQTTMYRVRIDGFIDSV